MVAEASNQIIGLGAPAVVEMDAGAATGEHPRGVRRRTAVPEKDHGHPTTIGTGPAGPHSARSPARRTGRQVAEITPVDSNTIRVTPSTTR